MQALTDLFISPADLVTGYTGVQLVMLIAFYAFVLFTASKLIADGSEMLTLVFNPGLVGGLVLPVLGAVPDGAIVLFSGLGPIDQAQKQLAVGVGALAGSTILLLTVPWALCIWLGRVDLSADGTTAMYKAKPKLTQGSSLTRTGIQSGPDVPMGAYIMLATSTIYLIIQGPAWANNMGAAKTCALVALIVAVLALVAYSVLQVVSARYLDMQKERQVQARTHALLSDVLDLATLITLEEREAEEFAETHGIELRAVVGGEVTQATLQKVRAQAAGRRGAAPSLALASVRIATAAVAVAAVAVAVVVRDGACASAARKRIAVAVAVGAAADVLAISCLLYTSDAADE